MWLHLELLKHINHRGSFARLRKTWSITSGRAAHVSINTTQGTWATLKIEKRNEEQVYGACYITLLFSGCSSERLSPQETGHQTLPLDSHSRPWGAFHPRIGNSSHAAITAFLLHRSDETLTATVWPPTATNAAEKRENNHNFFTTRRNL